MIIPERATKTIVERGKHCIILKKNILQLNLSLILKALIAIK